MRVFAYCAQTFAEATAKAAGVAPITCPPESAASVIPAGLAGYDLLYFDLHGEPGRAEWYGDGGLVALTADQIRSANLAGAVVFATSCFLAPDQPERSGHWSQVLPPLAESPMLDALLAAGARCVVAGAGQNLAGGRTVAGAHLLGEVFRLALGAGADPHFALRVAKASVFVDGALGSQVHKRAAADTLQFEIFERLERKAV